MCRTETIRSLGRPTATSGSDISEAFLKTLYSTTFDENFVFFFPSHSRGPSADPLLTHPGAKTFSMSYVMIWVRTRCKLYRGKGIRSHRAWVTEGIWSMTRSYSNQVRTPHKYTGKHLNILKRGKSQTRYSSLIWESLSLRECSEVCGSPGPDKYFEEHFGDILRTSRNIVGTLGNILGTFQEHWGTLRNI